MENENLIFEIWQNYKSYGCCEDATMDYDDFKKACNELMEIQIQSFINGKNYNHSSRWVPKQTYLKEFKSSIDFVGFFRGTDNCFLKANRNYVNDKYIDATFYKYSEMIEINIEIIKSPDYICQTDALQYLQMAERLK